MDKPVMDWDRCYTRDFTDEWDEKPLIEHRRMDVCPLCHLTPCLKDCYNAGTARYSGTEADYNVRDVTQEERGRRDLE